MKILFVTIVLDGMPFIAHHLPVFNQLTWDIDWKWSIVEGVAAPILDTAWCKGIPGRHSVDGTWEYLCSISRHPRVKIGHHPFWPGKTAQINAALDDGPYDLVWQIDADEIWTANQIYNTAGMFMYYAERNCADFHCRYFVGQNIVVDRIPGTWTNQDEIMWRRVWRWFPGFKFASHEPPVVEGHVRKPFTHEATMQRALVFDHYAYVTEAQVRFKEEYYGYAGALEGWRRLQANTVWPTRLSEFLPWVKDAATGRPIYEH